MQRVTTPAPARIPVPTLLLGAGGVALVIGSLLPWVTVGSIFSISGITSKYGIGTLLVGLFALLAAFGAGRVFVTTARRPVMIGTAVLGVAALGLAVYVGFAIRDSVAKSDSRSKATGTAAPLPIGTSDPSNLDQSFQDAFKGLQDKLASVFAVHTGFGVYVTALGGALVIGGAALSLREPSKAVPV